MSINVVVVISPGVLETPILTFVEWVIFKTPYNHWHSKLGDRFPVKLYATPLASFDNFTQR